MKSLWEFRIIGQGISFSVPLPALVATTRLFDKGVLVTL